MPNYQVMPDLSVEDFSALKADIAARGVLVPIEVDEAGNVLDGHHRLRAVQELGLTKCPRTIRTGLTEEEKRQHARQLNLARRHLTREQKRDLIAAQLKDTPTKSNRQVAAGLGVDDKTVGAVRGNLERRAEIPHVSKTIDKSGRSQAANRPPKVETPKSRRIHAVSDLEFRDAEFQAEAEAAARDIEIERDERIALAGAGALEDENTKMRAELEMLRPRVATLMTENAALQRQVKYWKERAKKAEGELAGA